MDSARKTTGHDPATALTDFKQYTMAHPHLQEMHDQVLRTIREPGGLSLLFLLGPTGVGKTTLISRLTQQLTLVLQTELEQNRERIAAAVMEAEAPSLGNYDFKQHFKRALTALGEILVDYRLAPQQPTREAPAPNLIIVHGATTVAALRGALEISLQRRKPVAFFIDEAHHLNKVTGMRKLQDHLDVIKSLANTTETLHVLVGTYELLSLLHLSDQLSRRSRTFHFERYRASHPPEVEIFQHILWNFQQRLPFVKPVELRAHSAYLMERSLGCVGMLKGWLMRAAALALEAQSETLTLQHLQHQQPTEAEWRSIATALLAGEESLREAASDSESLRWRLQADGQVSKARASAHSLTGKASGTTAPAGSSRQPGERLPRRDPLQKK